MQCMCCTTGCMLDAPAATAFVLACSSVHALAVVLPEVFKWLCTFMHATLCSHSCCQHPFGGLRMHVV
jgi:hypothetical protein